MSNRVALQTALDFAANSIKEELTAQGHVASGKTLKSIRTEITQKGDVLIGRVYIADHAFILDKGVAPSRVPYNPGSGAKSSLYIQKLIEWIDKIKPGMGDMQKKSFAFAIAATAKREGHPTKGSYSFSKNGRRKSWAKYAIQEKRKDIIALLEIGPATAALVHDMVSRIRKIA